MVEQVATASINSSSLNSFILIIIPLALLIYGIILLIKSKDVSSKSLKIGMWIPFVLNFSFILPIIFGILILYWALMPIFILSLISVIFSILAIIKTERKALAIASLIYGLIFLIISGFMNWTILFSGIRM